MTCLKLFAKLFLVIFVLITVGAAANGKDRSGKRKEGLHNNDSATVAQLRTFTDSLYDAMQLAEAGLQKDVFFTAYKGYNYLRTRHVLRKNNLLTICDYSQSIHCKRLYVIDLNNSQLLYHTYVAHGINSGNEYARSFSNSGRSNKSCLGFLVTEETYTGMAGLSLRLNGMEPGINDNARNRAIVLHGSWLTKEQGNDEATIIRSLGCPAVPYGQHLAIIQTIKGGSCFFINYPDAGYAKKSVIANARIKGAQFAAMQIRRPENIARKAYTAMNMGVTTR